MTVRHRLDAVVGAFIGEHSRRRRLDWGNLSVLRIDLATTLVSSFDTGVWVSRDAEVSHLDAATGEITETFTLELAGLSPGDMLSAFGALWTSASEDAILFRAALD